MKAKNVVYVDQFSNGVLDPNEDTPYLVSDGGRIIANTTPGCWGPMITPKLKGEHEVTKPVYVEGAEIGDAIAIYIENIDVTSIATASGNDKMVEDNFISDPYVDPKCPNCGEVNPNTYIEGVGRDAIRCENCGQPFLPFELTNAYTMVFNHQSQLGMTVNQEQAEKLGKDGRKYMKTPENSIQNPIVSLAPHDIPGVIARMRPFLGQLGTTPSRAFPDSHNAGDFAQNLIGAQHDYAMTEAEIEDRTDGHLDINRVRPGSVLISPVKTKGGGVYLGDMHAMQGDGEIAGHTTDVSGIVTLRVEIIKNINNEGPILLPNMDDLPYLAKPLTNEEREKGQKLSETYGNVELEESYPVSFIGSGANLNEATTNGMSRAANLFNVPIEEIMNRCTISGSIDIGRHPGMIIATFLAPIEYLEKTHIKNLVMEQYD